MVAGCALTAIVYGLQAPERWNRRFNPQAGDDAAAGRTHWLTIGGVVAALMIGAVALMAALAIAMQAFFESGSHAEPAALAAPAFRTAAG